jgi:DNA-binding CsgD family transcriptional regulator
VSFGDLWAAGPAPVYLLFAGAQILPLWWIGRRPVLGLAMTSVAFLAAQSFAWPATSADLSIFAALATVGARTRPRTAIASAAAVTAALAAFMAAAQAPGRPEAIGQAIFPAAWIVAVPLLIGMAYQRVGRRPAAALAPDVGPASTHGVEPAATERRDRDQMRLTARELMILNLVADGLTNTEIATKLTIGRETVKTHIGNILAKLGARDRTHAVRVAYRNQLIDDR